MEKNALRKAKFAPVFILSGNGFYLDKSAL